MDLYKILNIKKSASQEDIKKAFRKASLKHHPDRGGNAEEFKKANRAYEILSDPIKKREYDYKKNSNFFGNNNTNIFNTENDRDMGDSIPEFFKMFFGGMPMGMNEDVFNNIEQNSTFFGNIPNIPNIRIYKNGRPVFKTKMKPADITKTIKIDLKLAYNGVNYPIEIERFIVENNIKKVEKETIYVDIPKGVDTNEIIKIEGRGNVGHDGTKGDVKIYIMVENNTNIKRHGLDLVYHKNITLKEALTGFMFELNHLNGKTYQINNSSIISPGFKSVINNMGMVRGERRGNMIIEFKIEFPKNLSDEQKKSLKNIL